MNEEITGEKIVKAVYKANFQALFAIGVKSPENIERFTQAFQTALDREFLKIGLLDSKTFVQSPEVQEFSSQEITPVQINELDEGTHSATVGNEIPTRTTYSPLEGQNIKLLKLKPLTIHRLAKVGVTTIEDLMTIMQQTPLTDIKGIKEKSAKEILAALNIWNTSS